MKNKIALISFVLLFFSFSRLFAQKEPVYLDMLVGDSIYTGNSLIVKDSVYYDPNLKPTIEHTYYINNIISLRINENLGKVLPDSFSLNLTIRVIYGTSETTFDSIQKVLNVTYNKFSDYNDKSIFLFSTAHYVEVKILSVSASYASTASIIPHLLLENRMVIERIYSMSCTNDAIHVISLDTTTIASVGEIKLSWTPNQVSQMYDVEWTYLDKSALDNGRYDNIHGNLDPNLIFKNNASRITTKADTCMIPLLYDGEGTLFYRIRGAKINPSGEVLTTEWSSERDTLAANWSYVYTGHETGLNWQASTSFAEEGKRKSVVQYFDGSLRARQVVTRDNTTMTTVVAETLYDKQGRPTIQVLPAPTLNTIIGYTPFFNVRDMNSAEYDKGVYDTLFSSEDYCAAQADSFSVVSGAAQYYSEQNPLSSAGFHRFIAQDSGYVFTQTQYTQDNTGRIYRQGGVGKQFQLGTGKETKYYYGTPDQGHLDALFGTEAGYAAHYQKNMVRDPNGQYSVSYVDMHGRTVATALAGAAPSSLDTIASYRRDSLETVEMLTSLNNIVDENAVEFTKTIFMTKRDSVWLNYSMATQGMTLKDCQDSNICYDCLYDLEISVIGECGSSVSGRNDTLIRFSNFPLWQVDTTCGIALPINITIPLMLEEGSYVINKTLRISEEGRSKYRDSVYLPHNTCKSYEDFYEEQLQIAKDSMSCATDTVNTHMYLFYREQMMADLHPLIGQYADTASSRSCFSIFNKRLWGYHKRWYVLVADTGVYRDEAGLPDSVLNSNGELVPPQQLTMDEFISNFKNSWAENLLSLHPEYCYLQQYEALATSHIWDEDFEKTDTYAEAVSKGYLNPVNSGLSPASNFLSTTDPFYNYSFGATAKMAITDSLFKAMPLAAGTPPASYATAWGLATAIAKCGDTLSAGGLWYWNQAAKNFNTTDLCVGELDMAWRIFRGIYLEKKREWTDRYIRSQCASWPYPQAPCQPVFPIRDSILSSAGYAVNAGAQNHTTGLAQADSVYAANCDSYISWWRQQLGNCYSELQKDILVAQLTLVCKEGADATHPYGASTIKPSSSHTYVSFDAVVNYYNNLWGINDPICNAFLIDKPLPYGKQMPLFDKETWNKPDSCGCAKVDSLYDYYSTYVYEGDFPTFASYLKWALDVDISTGDADTLRMICDGTITCKFLPEPVAFPKELQCGYTLPSCVPCMVFSVASDSFTTRFPSIVPTLNADDSTQRLKNEVYENFMNQWFGFNIEWYQYLEFQAYCDSVVIDPLLLLCNNDSSSVLLASDPCTDTVATAITAAIQLYEIYKDSLINHFNDAYNKKCLNTASLESFTITKPVSEYHYTLYYYDLAGNLIKTIPPEGVKANRSQVWLNQVVAARAGGQHLPIIHELPTVYRYNSLNQVVSQQSPDGGLSKFWYDRLGRLVVSQNSKQNVSGNFSYTKYDAIGRVVEVGQKLNEPASQSITTNPVALEQWMNYLNFDNAYHPTQVTRTFYDSPSDYSAVYEGLTPFSQREHTLRNRVSRVTNYDQLYIEMAVNNGDTTYTPLYSDFNTAIEYSYDIHGNVDSMLNIVQYTPLPSDLGANAFKYIAYKYDLISGKVNEVHYNAGYADEYYHRYEYDADNRLTDVSTTDNKAFLYQTGLEEHDAHYQYYKHGPLARMILGHQQVQGLDYAYTLQGWLKGVNSTALNPDYDMGSDGKAGGSNAFVGRDAFSFQLNYFNNDYKAVNSNVRPFAGHSAYLSTRQLYNGNISSMGVNIGKFNLPQLYNYSYDQLNRITGMDVHRGLDSLNNLWTSALSTPLDDYKERVRYDGNGNILSYLRNGESNQNLEMDDLSYSYNSGTNQLSHILDNVDPNNYEMDVDSQEEGNYSYDQIGNIVIDRQEGLYIDWNVYGKIRHIYKEPWEGSEQPLEIHYMYDPIGNRVGKWVGPPGGNPGYDGIKATWYVRDAQGNVMAVYRYEINGGGRYRVSNLKLAEHHVYGSSRLGVSERDHDMTTEKGTSDYANLIGTTYLYSTVRGKKFFELSNHLGSVLVTISDKKTGVDSDGNGTVDWYEADVLTATDLYPFGMTMPGRSYNAGAYRYGFNGQEKSSEINDNSYTAEFWQYDARIGRRWNVDPVVKPNESAYATFANSPIWLSDPNGKDTTLPAADGRNLTLPTGATFETFQANTKYTHASNGKEVNVTPGSISAFTVDGNRYTARFDSETLAFTGYQDANGNSIVQTNTIALTGGYTNPLSLTGAMYGWDSYTRLNSYIKPMTEARNLFQAGELSANSASIRRFFFLQDARSKLSPLGDFVSESPLFNGKSLDKAREQASKVMFSELDEASKARKVFNLRASTTNWARFGRVAGPALTIATQGYVYYTIIRDKPSVEKLQDDMDTPFNPGYWLYRRTFGKLVDKVAQ